MPRSINPNVQVDVHPFSLEPNNSQEVLAPYDILLDCTDNAPTRYLLSDTAVALGKPLVSGAALRFDGQLCTYNLGNGPCYRCLYPKPAARSTMGSCEENGILGPVVGTIGTLQALEAIKILTGLHGMIFVRRHQGENEFHDIIRWDAVSLDFLCVDDAVVSVDQASKAQT